MCERENTRKRKKRSSSLGKNNGSEKSLKTSNSNSQIHLNVGKDVRISNEKIIENFFENCSKYVDDKLESLNKFFNEKCLNTLPTPDILNSCHVQCICVSLLLIFFLFNPNSFIDWEMNQNAFESSFVFD